MRVFPTLYILRHGETEWNATGRLHGRFDSPLTEVGRAQAIAQRRILGRLDLAGFGAVSSPQGRAVDTAKIAFDGLFENIPTDSRLSEIGLGAWAGLSRPELMRQEGVESGFDLYSRAPEGEGFEALRARCTSFLGDLKGPTVIMTHGITSRMLRLIITGLPTCGLAKLQGGQGVVFYLSRTCTKMLSDRA